LIWKKKKMGQLAHVQKIGSNVRKTTIRPSAVVSPFGGQPAATKRWTGTPETLYTICAPELALAAMRDGARRAVLTSPTADDADDADDDFAHCVSFPRFWVIWVKPRDMSTRQSSRDDEGGVPAWPVGTSPSGTGLSHASRGAGAPSDHGSGWTDWGLRNLWNAWTGNLLRQVRVPTSGALNPAPILTYNSQGPGATPNGNGFLHSYQRSITTVAVGVVDLTNGTGAKFRYTGPVTQGQYTPKSDTTNGLLLNADGTWTETQPERLGDGLVVRWSLDRTGPAR
jgi:hypothetical protein